MKKIYFVNKALLVLFLQFVISASGNAQGVQEKHKTVPSKLSSDKISQKKIVYLHEKQLKRCSAVEADASLRNRYPTLPKQQLIEKELQSKIKDYKKAAAASRTAADEVYVIPVIVHVIHNGQAVGVGPNITAAQVKSQIDVLNEDFRRKPGTPGFNNKAVGADVQIEFALALRDPNGKVLTEPGIRRYNGGRSTWNSLEDIETILKPGTQWDPTRYLNMWTVTYGEDLEDYLGYAQFPVLSGLQGMDDRTAGLASTDGLVMRHSAFGSVGSVEAPYNKGRTTTHEIGHWLGLRHIWGDREGCEGSDYCEDTPTAANPNYKCIAGTNSCTSLPGNDMIENYMDYTNDECMNIFTIEQKNRMRTVMLNSPRRKELIQSTVHIPVEGNLPFAAFTVSSTKACLGSTISFTDQSTNTPTSWLWSILSSTGTVLTTSTLRNPTFTFNSAGVYSVTLKAKNASGEDTEEKTGLITILASTNMSLPFSETFEQRGLPVGWTMLNPDEDREWIWVEVDNAEGVGVNGLGFDNYSTKTDPTGTVDAIVSSKINMSTNLYAELSFDVAYAMYEDEDGVYFDSLVLYYSTDCGQTYTPFWKKWGQDLSTGPTTDESFFPSTSQWRKEKISLSFLNGESSVQLAIANVSGWGNNLFIDNIKLVVPTPTAAPVAAFSTKTREVCPGSSVKFTDNSTNYPRQWSWSFQGGKPATSTLQNPTVVYNTPGTYAVTLVAKNTIGSNTKTTTSYITVGAQPNFTIAGDKINICAGDSVLLVGNGGVAKDYIWKDKIRGQIGKGPSILVKPGVTSTYILEGQNEQGCNGTASYQITVNPSPEKPTVSISDVSTTNITLSTSATSNIQWLLNNQPISGATEPTLEISASGSYAVKTTENGCSAISDATLITGTDDEISFANSVMLYPNPTSNNLTVNAKPGSAIKMSRVILYNSLGVALEEKPLVMGKGVWETNFNLSKYSKGTYFIRVEYQGLQVKKSVIKY